MEKFKGYDAYSTYTAKKIGTVIESNNSHTKIKTLEGEIVELPNHLIVLDAPKTKEEIEASKEQAKLDDEFEGNHPPIDIN